MNDSTNIIAPHERVKLTDISSRSWEHPADRAALRSLEAIPGFAEVIRKIVALFGERGLRLFFQANAVRVTENQYGWVYDLHRGVVDTLDLGWEPELYISQTPFVNAGALGVDKPFVLINSGAVDVLTPEELETVLERLRKLSAGAEQTVCIWNNHPTGQAAVNALQTMHKLLKKKVKAPPTLKRKYPQLETITEAERGGMFD